MNSCVHATKWHGTRAAIVSTTNSVTEYAINCDTPNGRMKTFHLFSGIDYALTTFEASSCDYRKHAVSDVIEIAYCKSGRFECEYKNGYFTYIGEGDFAIGVLEAQTEKPYFPLGYYTGCTIIIDVKKTGMVFQNTIEGISIDLAALLQNYCPDNKCAVIKTPSMLLRIFNELYEASQDCRFPSDTTNGYLRLKVLELLFLLQHYKPQKQSAAHTCFSGVYIKKIKAIKADITEHWSENPRLKDLSQKYGIGLTVMKDCFKAVYGKPIYAFQKEYKMQKAAQLLHTTEKSITEIASLIGYENPNKFSSAFKNTFGCSPREYRRNNL